MPILDLTRKLCWLLGTCIPIYKGGPRFRRRHCIPKGTKRKSTYYKVGSDLAPPKPRYLSCTRLRVLHPKDDQVKITPLIRRCDDLSVPITSERIGKHIQSISQLIPGWDNSRKFKARAVGATLALKKGISVDDVMIQGNWSSTDIVNEFYRLSRSTAQNFTNVVLDNSGVTSIVSSVGRTMDSVVEQSDD
ncbi:hypothetical protein BGZ76_002427 [Entomortierella beljakovae]|nr:hypothetical protein BGZ76_002427 [Entomortierella beljakovae]